VTSPHPRIAVIQHEDGCPLGLFDSWLRAAGADLTILRPYLGEQLPAAADTDGLVVLGGSMSAMSGPDDQRHPWLPATRDLLRQAVDAGLPTLGICLGHQLLAVACGGRVEPNPEGKQMGVMPVGFTPLAVTEQLFASTAVDGNAAGAGSGAAGVAGVAAIQWNDDIVVELPAETVTLARTPDGVPQAIRVGDAAWGVQFHPEADDAIVADWAKAEGPVTAVKIAAIDAIAAAAADLEATWRPFAARFVTIASMRLTNGTA
jgi:GMP synthase (glutamine-hydrolysing)